jgi:hypothetical protein
VTVAAHYQVYLDSPAWSAKRREYKASGLPQTCLVCGDHRVDLHHLTYKRVGAERLTDLAPLCRVHHYGAHEHHRATGLSLYSATQQYIKLERAGGAKSVKPKCKAKAKAKAQPTPKPKKAPKPKVPKAKTRSSKKDGLGFLTIGGPGQSRPVAKEASPPAAVAGEPQLHPRRSVTAAWGANRKRSKRRSR